MAHIQIDIYGKGLMLPNVMKKIRPLFNLDKVNLSGRKVKAPVTRADRLSAASEMLSNAQSVLEELRDEIEQWKSGMEGTNLESTEKYQQLEECYEKLAESVDNIQGVELDGIEFPSMY